MASKVAFGFIPVPVEETTKILTGTPLTELLVSILQILFSYLLLQMG